MEKRLYRSTRDRMVAGVCGGIGEYFGVDPTLVRIAAVALALADGLGIVAYLILWIFVPQEGQDTMTTSPASDDSAPVGTAHEDAAAPAAQAPAPDPAPVSAPTEPAPVAAPAFAPAPAAPVGGDRPARGGITGGVILIVIGGIFLVSQFVPGLDIGKLWPLILIAIGVTVILRSGRR